MALLPRDLHARMGVVGGDKLVPQPIPDEESEVEHEFYVICACTGVCSPLSRAGLERACACMQALPCAPR